MRIQIGVSLDAETVRKLRENKVEKGIPISIQLEKAFQKCDGGNGQK